MIARTDPRWQRVMDEIRAEGERTPLSVPDVPAGQELARALLVAAEEAGIGPVELRALAAADGVALRSGPIWTAIAEIPHPAWRRLIDAVRAMRRAPAPAAAAAVVDDETEIPF